MNFRNYLTAAIVSGVFLAAACSDAAKPPVLVNSSSPAANQAIDTHEDDAPRITPEEAKRDFDNGTAVFIDTHSKDQFDASHIPGAINIPTNLVKFNLDKIPKGKKIIAYCS